MLPTFPNFEFWSEVGRMFSTSREIVFRARVLRDVSCVRSCGREVLLAWRREDPHLRFTLKASLQGGLEG